ncbi:DNA-packaging protein [Pseudorhizobium halotolerans]|uniref:DNA-packaging protein n=1 Tax=Pseudorhizobium halotolerans TaxID=1233081 RepID=A0ABM8PSL8_9HYPH|nr:DNA-packaging protein [Pseudorhizobium halotolerans]
MGRGFERIIVARETAKRTADLGAALVGSMHDDAKSVSPETSTPEGEMSRETREQIVFPSGLQELSSGYAGIPPSALSGISPSRGEIEGPGAPPFLASGSEDPYEEFHIGFEREWRFAGRREQRPPPGDWRTWLVMGGRGSGKTRAGAEWVQALISADGDRSELRIALVAETLGEAREVMVDGVSGICRIARGRHRPEFEISRRRIVWRNGAVAQIFSSEDPESLRGPQFHYAWCDELAKWKHAEETFDMLQFGLRLGRDPRQLVTTTPRPVPLLKRLMADAGTRLVRIATSDNAGNLAPGFLVELQKRYGGTRLGRQEIDGELIEDREDALWKRAEIEACTVSVTEALRRIVVAVDPPSGSGEHSCCGIVVAGLDAGGRAVVLADCSVEGMTPAGWARAVANTYRRFAADRIVAEVNQGGEMVAAMLRSVDVSLPLTLVRATRGKYLRAEPVAALYEQRRVVHAGRFVELEDQMCDFGPEGLSSGRSPDRLDALVWALTALLIEGQGEPRVRGI